METRDLLNNETYKENIKYITIKGVEYKYLITKMENEDGISIKLSEVKPDKNITFDYHSLAKKISEDIKFLSLCDNIEEMINSLYDMINKGKVTVEEKKGNIL